MNELCDFLADGPTDSEAFARAAMALEVSESACRTRFHSITMSHPQFYERDLGWRP